MGAANATGSKRSKLAETNQYKLDLPSDYQLIDFRLAIYGKSKNFILAHVYYPFCS